MADHARFLRSDALPENSNYRDTGCSAHSRCLTCPFVECLYDVVGPSRTDDEDIRDGSIAEMRGRGVKPPVIAAYFRVSLRTVHRATARFRC